MDRENNFDTGLVNRFSWHKNNGDFAEFYFRNNYFKWIGLNFRKIRKDKKGKKPDGYIFDSNKDKIAVAEIKLIQNQNIKTNKVQLKKIDNTITRSIKSAREQLRTIDGDLPRVVYLILDDIFAKFKTVKTAIFGKWVTINNTIYGTVYNGYSGLCNRYRENNKLRDNLTSAVICYKKTLNSYEIYIIQNSDSIKLPSVLRDNQHLKELWDYNSKRLKQIFPKSNI